MSSGSQPSASGAAIPDEVYGDSIFDHGRDTEVSRLSALTEELDPVTWQCLQAVGVAAHWHCLELGAGTGTVSERLARVCHQGSVLATDLDLTYLPPPDDTNLTVRRHDVTAEDLPTESFDLIHARYLLCHLRERNQVLRKVVSWLKPGGWLLLEEPAQFPITSSPHSAYHTVSMGIFSVLAERIGTDCHWARHLPQSMAAAGLTEIGVHVTSSLVGGDRPMSRFWRLTLEQLAPHIVDGGHATAAQVREVATQLADAGFHDLGMATVSVWGRKEEMP
ncbi:methyltransferase [Streptomyces sp. NPDC058629]|uniref:class I SAM-dependent methyltransferase n=1 Tax=Streptomyces sp. NPDC058629 TaxID=3346565 RepID=UPI003655B9B4